MPFMKGRAPVRRTIKYLEAGNIYLKDKIKILTINYNTQGREHHGAREFIFWTFPQLQYKNPDVQIVTFKNMTPTPFIKCYYEDGKSLVIDIDSQKHEDIVNHLKGVVCKTKEVLESEAAAAEKKDNPANFGVGCDRSCMCEIPGQVPCPGAVRMPYNMRGKYIRASD